ncbi:hypothetical protein GCM10007276_24820 [Agaricicola taiwanensis]|uniref:Uncharacterized protein n=1 Tax=Agaricicola taiwanensis TaxID=591372 RepID=A0A8J3DUY4_9RHOB|nr:hypothetical protein GCM10007276_24820 [Agaricicola taiwanensis]
MEGRIEAAVAGRGSPTTAAKKESLPKSRRVKLGIENRVSLIQPRIYRGLRIRA